MYSGIYASTDSPPQNRKQYRYLLKKTSHVSGPSHFKLVFEGSTILLVLYSAEFYLANIYKEVICIPH